MLAEYQQQDMIIALDTYDIIVIGSGPVGVRLIQELLRKKSARSIALFGDEPWKPYNRIHLSSLVSGEQKEEAIYTQTDFSKQDTVTTFYNHRIIDINPYNKTIIDDHGKKYSYKDLVIATGSKSYIPEISGTNLKNVFTFRDLTDAQFLIGRSVRTRKTVIIGGGLLGLEAAKAMQRFNTNVTVIEHSLWLMFSQLDQHAGSYLKRHVENMGIDVRVSSRINEIVGTDKVEGVMINNDEFIECDTIIIAAGIKPNIEIARNSGLRVGKGIKVNDCLQTNDKNIYAIGECAEHNNKLYGLVGPGYEQAAALALQFDGQNIKYKGSSTPTQLKVIDYDVFSVGNTGHSARERECIIYQDHKKEIYRKIVVINGRIRGMIAIGQLNGSARIQQAVAKQLRIWPWHIKRFKEKGSLWIDEDLENVNEWPDSAIVCNCTGVTRGRLEQSKTEGAVTVELLSKDTGASTVCGTCRHLLANFIDSQSTPTPVLAYKTLLTVSTIAILLSLIIFVLPGIFYNSSVQQINWDMLWRDSLFKQVSGFSLLGLSLVISIISIRKRWRNIIKKWDFAYWRIAHVLIGLILMSALLIHTGFRFGHNLNFYLMLVFSGLLISGAIAGAGIATDHNLSRKTARRLRSFSVWSHIILLWPLPGLLGFHIIKTYFY